jgi:hypothetical protein
MFEYKRYKIDGESIPMFMSGCESLGTVYRNGRAGSVIAVATDRGRDFDNMKKAEAHGLVWRRSGWIENAWNYSRWCPGRDLSYFVSTRANNYVAAMSIADPTMVFTLSGLRREAGLESQSRYAK